MGVTITPATSIAVEIITSAITTFSMVAAEDIDAKETVCQSQTVAGECYKADANDSTKMPVIGIASEAAAIGETLDIYNAGRVTSVVRDTDFSIGDIVYAGIVPGQVTKTLSTSSGTGQQRLGVATDIDDILLAIDLTIMWIP